MNNNCTAMIVRGWNISARTYADLIQSDFPGYAIVDDLYADNAHFFFGEVYKLTSDSTTLDPEDIANSSEYDVMAQSDLYEHYAEFLDTDVDLLPDAHLFLILQVA